MDWSALYLQNYRVLQCSINLAEYCKSHTESHVGRYVSTHNKNQHLLFRRVLFLYYLSFSLLLIPLSAAASCYLLLQMTLQQACTLFPSHDQRSLVNQFSSAEDDFNSKETQSLITVLSTLSKHLDPASQQVLHNLHGLAGMGVVAMGEGRRLSDWVDIWGLWHVCMFCLLLQTPLCRSDSCYLVKHSPVTRLQG